MKDPWRVVDPMRQATPPGVPADGKIDLATKDFDADWRPSRACILRFRACSIEIAGIYLNTPEDALSGLARCVIALKRAGAAQPRAHRLLAAVHARVPGDDQDEPPPGTVSARLSCGRVVLEFAGTTLENGALALARALMAAGRDPQLGPILRKSGVTPMLRTT